jgi:dipeptidase E
MKLYLSSNDIPNVPALEDLVGKSTSSMRVALISNAKDYYNDLLRRYKVNVGITKLEKLGMAVTEVDLRQYHGKQDQLQEDLERFDLVWGLGGNSFCLRSEMQLSGFDQIIRPLLDTGVVYGGESAGAIVASKTLKGIETIDFPAATNNVIWEGMQLTDHVILPHADDVGFTEVVKTMRSMYEDESKYLELNNNQVLVVNNGKEAVLSS